MSLRKMIESIAAGKNVPCGVCGEPLILVRARSGGLVGAKCPYGHESWPYPQAYGKTVTTTKLVESVVAGENVPCLVCGEPLILMRVGSGEIEGAKCPRGHMSYLVPLEGYIDNR